MGKFYNISGKITNELPVIKITDDLTVTVNNRTQTVLNVQAMMQETERNTDGETGLKEEYEKMNKAMTMMIGEKNAQQISDMDLPIDEYTTIFRAIVAVSQGREPDEQENNTP